VIRNGRKYRMLNIIDEFSRECLRAPRLSPRRRGRMLLLSERRATSRQAVLDSRNFAGPSLKNLALCASISRMVLAVAMMAPRCSSVTLSL